MKKTLLVLLILSSSINFFPTEPPEGIPAGTVIPPPSIHQMELEKHNAMMEIAEPPYPLYYSIKPDCYEKGPKTEALSRTVYGFMPYWVAPDLTHMRWDLLSHVAYFSAELDSAGSITAAHNWPSGTYVQALINTAHTNGVKVTLAVTLFSSTSLTTLLSSSANRQNAISNLLSQVQAGNADGVCIDFEGVPSAQKANLVTFMTDLSAAFHSAIPGSHVSICTPAVDWSGAFDYDQLAIICDGLFIMAYDYYYKGSTTAGPVSPKASSTRWGSKSVTWTINDYITYGGTGNKGKFIVGLPYYGYEWPTASTTVPSSTTGTGVARLYDSAKVNAAAYGRLWDSFGEVPYYIISSGPNQCFYDDAESLGLKWDMVNSNDLGGTGMWALNYDTGDEELWNTLSQKFSPSAGDLAGVDIGVDPGHGGTEPGAVGPTGLNEKVVNLSASFMLRDALQARGAAVYMTRTDDSTVSLAARTAYLNSIPVDRSESYHHNACGTPGCGANYTGAHVYWTSANGCNAASANSRDMAAKTALRLDEALDIGVVASNCSPSIYGVHGDNFAMVRDTSMPAMLTEATFIDNASEEALLKTDARKCLIAGAIAKGIEDHYLVTATDPPCASGTCGNPILINSFPYTDNNDTTGRNESFNGYSCPPVSGSEAGPEVIYLVTVPLAGTLTVMVTDTTADIDPHLLSSCNPNSCIVRADTAFTLFVQPGDYYLVCDTYTDSGGTKYPGAYTLNVNFTADTTAPKELQDLKWVGGRWEWSAVTLDRLNNPETLGYYQMWRATNLLTPNFSLVQDHITSTYLDDAETPSSGTCWYYFLHTVDAAGNRDVPDLTWTLIYNQAAYAGTWTAGGFADCLGGTGQYKSAGTATTPTATATWSFEVEETGNYTVSARYVAGVTNRTTVRYTTSHTGGSTTTLVDQTINNCAWMPLGTYTMKAGTVYTVVLDNQAATGKVAIAEAVRWQK